MYIVDLCPFKKLLPKNPPLANVFINKDNETLSLWNQLFWIEAEEFKYFQNSMI